MPDGEQLEATLEAPEVMPNEPAWLFYPSIPKEERERYTNEIVAGLKTVYDPEIPCDIYELGLIYKVDIAEDRSVKVDMTLTAPGCPVAGDLARAVEAAVDAVQGVLSVDVAVVFEPRWDQSRMSDEAHLALDMF